MTSIFQRARQSTEEQPEEAAPIFQGLKKHKQENIIPPVGIAKPEDVDAFLQNIGDEDKIRETIQAREDYEKENAFETAKRETFSHGARGLEGFFGGIGSFLNALTPDLELEDESTGEIERHKPTKLPGANELREKTKEKTGQYLEPKNEVTKATQEIASDIGSMFSTPGLGIWSKILMPLGGQATKQFIKASGGGQTAQNIGKLGFTLVSSIAGLGNAQRAASQALNQAEQMIPQGVRFSANATQQALNNIRNRTWFRTGSTPSKAPAMAEIERIENAIHNGTMDAHEAMQLRRDINEARRQLGGFQLNRPVNKADALRHLDEVDQALLSSMENYGQNVNPQWLRSYTLGNEAYRVTQRSRLVSDLVEKYAKPIQSQTAKTLFHVGAAGAGGFLPTVATIGIPGLAAAKTIQIINRMIRSPVIRNHYIEVLAAASSGNAANFNKAMERFDKVAKKLEDHKKDQ